MVFLVFVLLAIASFVPGALPQEHISCLHDELFEQTEEINDYFSENPATKNGFMIFCSLCMDITMVVGFVVFAIHGKTWRLPIALALFYVLRTIVQRLFLLRYPEGYLWDYPGFPSLVVPYGKTNDFFYSGHAGGATIMTLEYRTLAKLMPRHRVFMRAMQGFGMLTVVFQLFLMIFLRGHYTIDLLSGLIFGHYMYIMGSSFAPIFDRIVCKMGVEDSTKHHVIQNYEDKGETFVSETNAKSS